MLPVALYGGFKASKLRFVILNLESFKNFLQIKIKKEEEEDTKSYEVVFFRWEHALIPVLNANNTLSSSFPLHPRQSFQCSRQKVGKNKYDINCLGKQVNSVI